MKAVILVSGLEGASTWKPTFGPPMIEIGGKPSLWHNLKSTRTMASLYTSDLTLFLAESRVEIHRNMADRWHWCGHGVGGFA